GGGGAAEARHDAYLERLAFARQVDAPGHRHLGRRAAHAELMDVHHAVIDVGRGLDAVEAKALRKDIAEVERDAPRQRLQVHERDQLAEPRIDLEELAVLGGEPELAGQARVVDMARLGRPAKGSGELRLAAENRVRVADAAEKFAGIARVQAEVEVGGKATAPAALGVERSVLARKRQLVDPPVRSFGNGEKLETAKLLAAQVEAFHRDI